MKTAAHSTARPAGAMPAGNAGIWGRRRSFQAHSRRAPSRGSQSAVAPPPRALGRSIRAALPLGLGCAGSHYNSPPIGSDMPALILEAPSHLLPAPSPWAFVRSADGQTVSDSGHSPVGLLPVPGKGTEVVLVLPVQDVSWHWVRLPQIALRDRARLRAVLQGLLEDQLLDEPEQLHFALEPQARAGAPCWVAVCQAERLQAHVTALAQQGLQVQRIVPAFAPPPQEPTDASDAAPAAAALYAIGTEDDPWLVAVGASQGGSAPAPQAGGVLALPLTASAAALDCVAQPGASVQAEPALYQLAQQRLGRPVQLLEPPQRLLQAAQSPWNLAQFQFANSGRDRLGQNLNKGLQNFLHAPAWRWARWGAALLVLVQLAGIQLWAWQARRDLQQLHAQVDAVFRSTFPKVAVVVDAPRQMRQELQRLQQQSGALTPGSFEVLAGAAGLGLPEDMRPQELHYENAQLRLGGLPQGSELLQQWEDGLAAQGLLAQWHEGRLQIEPAPTTPTRGQP
ncbi:general secretion pathway protein GspL [Vandammella animalimorsus]|uniref:General secretion pathway protein GspL n=2 Tax=Vandammella animalimorsus TaxID=2029117 RepID=A0A2A2AJK2_9BURK|nr:general secretion pathway protein GspL [Vandammella animalimorsus]